MGAPIKFTLITFARCFSQATLVCYCNQQILRYHLYNATNRFILTVASVTEAMGCKVFITKDTAVHGWDGQ